LWFFVEGGEEVARSGNCHGEIHKIASSGGGSKIPLKAMPFLHGLFKRAPQGVILFRRWVGYPDAKDITNESFVEDDVL
jgi:hypothetical protein